MSVASKAALITLNLSSECTLFHADMRDALRTVPDDSVDSVITDPPYHLVSTARASRGFMGKQWDGGDIAFQVETWAEVWRVLKPGGHVAAFGSTRGYHRMACAIEDAGFEIRDSLMWIFGSGFPKSHDVSKGIDSRDGRLAEQGIPPPDFDRVAVAFDPIIEALAMGSA